MFYKIERTCCGNKGTKGSLMVWRRSCRIWDSWFSRSTGRVFHTPGQAWGAILPSFGVQKGLTKEGEGVPLVDCPTRQPSTGPRWPGRVAEGNGLCSELCDQVMEQGTWKGARSRQHSSTFEGRSAHTFKSISSTWRLKWVRKPQEVGEPTGAGTQSRLSCRSPSLSKEVGEGWNDFSSWKLSICPSVGLADRLENS